MSYNTSIIIVVILFVTIANAAVVPSYMQVCSRNIPNFSECITNSVNNLRPYLKKGIPELNVPSLEPLAIGNMKIMESGKTGLEANVQELMVKGASSFEITSLRVSKNHKNFDFELNLPQLQGNGQYTLNGQILALPLKGNGPFIGNFTGFSARVQFSLDKLMDNGVERVVIKNINLKIRPGTGSIQLKNLFNGDKALGDVVNETINQNFKSFVDEVIEPIQTALEKKFISITSKIFENFTFSQLFPEI